MEWTGYGGYARKFFAAFVLFVFASNAFEIATEFLDGESLAEMANDMFGLTVSAMVLIVFVVEYVGQRRALAELSSQLRNVRGRLAEIDKESHQLATRYRQTMRQQFETWQLTSSEQDVVIMLLKGLSFREIAGLRETREKTVRQQASSVYRKAGLANRHELAAWFFEDLLEPDPAGK